MNILINLRSIKGYHIVKNLVLIGLLFVNCVPYQQQLEEQNLLKIRNSTHCNILTNSTAFENQIEYEKHLLEQELAATLDNQLVRPLGFPTIEIIDDYLLLKVRHRCGTGEQYIFIWNEKYWTDNDGLLLRS